MLGGGGEGYFTPLNNSILQLSNRLFKTKVVTKAASAQKQSDADVVKEQPEAASAQEQPEAASAQEQPEEDEKERQEKLHTAFTQIHTLLFLIKYIYKKAYYLNTKTGNETETIHLLKEISNINKILYEKTDTLLFFFYKNEREIENIIINIANDLNYQENIDNIKLLFEDSDTKGIWIDSNPNSKHFNIYKHTTSVEFFINNIEIYKNLIDLYKRPFKYKNECTNYENLLSKYKDSLEIIEYNVDNLLDNIDIDIYKDKDKIQEIIDSQNNYKKNMEMIIKECIITPFLI